MPSKVCKAVKKTKKTTTSKKKTSNKTATKKKTTPPRRKAKACPKPRRRQARRACRRSCHVDDFDIPLQFAQISTPLDDLAQNIQLAQQPPVATTPATQTPADVFTHAQQPSVSTTPADVVMPKGAIDGAEETAHKNISFEDDPDGSLRGSTGDAVVNGEATQGDGQPPPVVDETQAPVVDDTPASVVAEVKRVETAVKLATDVLQVLDASPYSQRRLFGFRQDSEVAVVRNSQQGLQKIADELGAFGATVRNSEGKDGVIIRKKLRAARDAAKTLFQDVITAKSKHNMKVYRLEDIDKLYRDLGPLDPNTDAEKRSELINTWESKANADMREVQTSSKEWQGSDVTLGTTTQMKVSEDLRKVLQGIVRGSKQKQETMYTGNISLRMVKKCAMSPLDPDYPSIRCGLTGVTAYERGKTILNLPQKDMLLWTSNSRNNKGADQTRRLTSMQNIVMSIRDLISALQAKPRVKQDPTMLILLDENAIWLSIQPVILKDEQLKRLKVVLNAVANAGEPSYLEGDMFGIVKALLGGYASVSNHQIKEGVWKRAEGVSTWTNADKVEDELRLMESLSASFVLMAHENWAKEDILKTLISLRQPPNDVGAANDGADDDGSDDDADDGSDDDADDDADDGSTPQRQAVTSRSRASKFLLGLVVAASLVNAAGEFDARLPKASDVNALVAIGDSAPDTVVQEFQSDMGDNLQRSIRGEAMRFGAATVGFMKRVTTSSLQSLYNLKLTPGPVDEALYAEVFDDVPANMTPSAVDADGNPIDAVRGTGLPVGGDMNGPQPNPSQLQTTPGYVEPQPDNTPF